VTEPVPALDPADDDAWADAPATLKLESLKATVTIFDVLEALDLLPNSTGKIPSPWNPDENTPSCHVYDDHFYDYSSGKGGDLFDLVQALGLAEDLMRSIDLVRRLAVLSDYSPGRVDRIAPAARLRTNFSPELEPLEKVLTWGIYNVRAYDIRSDVAGNLYVPHRDPDGVYGVKVRYASGGKGSWAGSLFMTRLYDPYGWGEGLRSNEAVICEGESDVWALDQYLEFHFMEIDVYGLPSGAGSWKDHWLEDLARYETVWVCMDNDEAGQRARDKLMLKIGYERAKELKVPTLYNDAREALVAGWSPFHRT
jgi:5S rRNA maturation endonuclease (ribonuclease M5)